MNDPTPGDITRLLKAAEDGDRAAFDEVYRHVYHELRLLARKLRVGKASPTINTTALVHEAYLKLVPGPSGPIQDRGHFFGIAARAMRQVLVDAARRAHAARRGGGKIVVELDESVHAGDGRSRVDSDDIIALDQALVRLQEWSPRQSSIVECRVFAGLSVQETARALSISEATVKRDWQTARAWLAHELTAP